VRLSPTGEKQRSLEELLADEFSRSSTRRDREQAGAGVLEVLLHRVHPRDAGLERHVLLDGVAHVGDEEQAGVEAAEVIVAVGEVVAAAQDLDSVVVRGMRDADAGVDVESTAARGHPSA